MIVNRSATGTLQHATKRGAKAIDEIREWEYGKRQVTLEDPFGHHWVLTETVTHTAPEQWGGVARSPRG